MTRRAITGAPKTGAKHTDAEINGRNWSEASAKASAYFNDQSTDLTVEGVAVPRALRKWLAANPEGKPVDELVVLDNRPHQRLTPEQRNLAKGVETVLKEIEPELRRRGVKIRRER
jgi:hypothetical protein